MALYQLVWFWRWNGCHRMALRSHLLCFGSILRDLRFILTKSYDLASRFNRKALALAVVCSVFHRCAVPTCATPVFFCSLESHVISCFLLSSTGKFSWKYGEVHTCVRGSSLLCTGRFTCAYGEVHHGFRCFTRQNCISVRGSSPGIILSGYALLYGEVHLRKWPCLAETPHTAFGRVV